MTETQPDPAEEKTGMYWLEYLKGRSVAEMPRVRDSAQLDSLTSASLCKSASFSPPIAWFSSQNRHGCCSNGLTSPSFSSKENSSLLPGLVTETPGEFLIGFLSHPLGTHHCGQGSGYCDHPAW